VADATVARPVADELMTVGAGGHGYGFNGGGLSCLEAAELAATAASSAYRAGSGRAGEEMRIGKAVRVLKGAGVGCLGVPGNQGHVLQVVGGSVCVRYVGFGGRDIVLRIIV